MTMLLHDLIKKPKTSLKHAVAIVLDCAVAVHNHITECLLAPMPQRARCHTATLECHVANRA